MGDYWWIAPALLYLNITSLIDWFCNFISHGSCCWVTYFRFTFHFWLTETMMDFELQIRMLSVRERREIFLWSWRSEWREGTLYCRLSWLHILIVGLTKSVVVAVGSLLRIRLIPGRKPRFDDCLFWQGFLIVLLSLSVVPRA